MDAPNMITTVRDPMSVSMPLSPQKSFKLAIHRSWEAACPTMLFFWLQNRKMNILMGFQ